jgi:hypothetical protein
MKLRGYSSFRGKKYYKRHISSCKSQHDAVKGYEEDKETPEGNNAER